MLDFDALLDKATHAANDAGDRWIVEHPHGDCCGGAYIELSDKRTKFAKFLMDKLQDKRTWSVSIKHKHRGTQHMGLNEAAIRAAYESLIADGVKGIRYKSYID